MNAIKKRFYYSKLEAFTLTEVLVVLIIIGILVLLALPNLLPLITKAKTTEAKLQLEHVFTLEKSYYYEHSKYSASLQDIGFIQEKLVSEDENSSANYRISIEQSTATSFTARATSVVDFDSDGVFNVWEINQDKKLTEITPD